jgi:hypothetical protein
MGAKPRIFDARRNAESFDPETAALDPGSLLSSKGDVFVKYPGRGFQAPS